MKKGVEMAKVKKAKGEHYVENKVFLQAMTDWKAECKLAEEEQKDLPKEEQSRPQVNNYIGECFFHIYYIIQRGFFIFINTSCNNWSA